MLSVGFSLPGAGSFLEPNTVVPLLIPRTLSARHDALGLRLRGLIAAHHEEPCCGKYRHSPRAERHRKGREPAG